jgi:hypothetical protein
LRSDREVRGREYDHGFVSCELGYALVSRLLVPGALAVVLDCGLSLPSLPVQTVAPATVTSLAISSSVISCTSTRVALSGKADLTIAQNDPKTKPRIKTATNTMMQLTITVITMFKELSP